MLKIQDLNVFYGQIHALRDLSLEVRKGQIVSMVGANGAGKSTLMMTIARILKAKSGSILVDGKPLVAEASQVLGQGVCLVPERRRLYANLTVKENLMMGAYLRRDKAGITEDMEKMLDLFPIMRERIKQYAGTLSGGEQQMLAIARGLMGRPRILMLDEPSLGLAPLIIQVVFKTIQEVRSQGMTIFMTEQNANKALAISDYAYVIETGRSVLSGPGQDLLRDPMVKRAYLGIKH
ncbi:MAG: ABC transporter ATP-binding protein [Holophaga sp.]|nr:ABC transporter ATP-binding protein [Holophaga sp.]